MCRELAEARTYLLDDSKWVTSTNTYKALQQQLTAAHEARLGLLRDLESAQADKEAAEGRAADRNILAQVRQGTLRWRQQSPGNILIMIRRDDLPATTKGRHGRMRY